MTIKNKKSAAMKYLEKISGGPLTLGAAISSIRLSEEETLATFAKKLDISVQHLCNIEKGLKVVSPERASRFAKILGYSDKQFIRLALQDILNQQGLKRFHVYLEAA